jgi:hypothetical protein
MSDLKSQMIRLGSVRPELRPHLLPILQCLDQEDDLGLFRVLRKASGSLDVSQSLAEVHKNFASVILKACAEYYLNHLKMDRRKIPPYRLNQDVFYVALPECSLYLQPVMWEGRFEGLLFTSKPGKSFVIKYNPHKTISYFAEKVFSRIQQYDETLFSPKHLM